MANYPSEIHSPLAKAAHSPALRKSAGRQKRPLGDPFPVLETTETPIMSTEEFNREDSRTPSPIPLPPFRPNSSVVPKSVNPLRPAQDILNRLMWDQDLKRPSKDKSNDGWTYIIGYLDRFEGIKETTLDEWTGRRSDRDGEDWVPMHRVMLVKKRFRKSAVRSDSMPEVGEEHDKEQDYQEEILWDRRERVDTVFGSGNSGRNLQSRDLPPGENEQSSQS